MVKEIKFKVRMFFKLLMYVCLTTLLVSSLFARENVEKTIGVCNLATNKKPIEVESDSGQKSLAYPNLSEAFFAVNQGVHKGEIQIEVCFDSIEREAAILNSQETESADYTKVTILPLKDDVTISAKTGYNALIALNGTDNITINGDNPNSSGINRNLTIKAWGGRSVIALQTRFHSRSKYDGASNNSFKNLNISGTATPSYGISMGGYNPGSNGYSNNQNTIINCALRRVRIGVFSGGKSSAEPNLGTIISNNDLSATGVERVRLVGIKVEYESNAVVSKNHIGGLRSTKQETQDQIGILLGGGKMSYMAKRCYIRCPRSVSNSLIAKNVINGIVGGDRQSVAGIYIYGYKNTTNRIENNLISGVIGSNKTPKVLAGIFVAGDVDSKFQMHNNSISMTGEYGSDAIHNPSYALVIWSEDISVSMLNNIFSNIQTAKNNPWAKSFVLGLITKSTADIETPYALIESNNNIFYSNGNNKGFIRTDSLQRREGKEVKDLRDWKRKSNNDSNSLVVDPLFVNPQNDLRLQEKSLAINSGINLNGKNTDAFGTFRPIKTEKVNSKESKLFWMQKTDIGAFEWKP